jgi:chromosome segregation ATPase
MIQTNADERATDETVALLLDEVARLENELRARDEAESWRAEAPSTVADPPVVPGNPGLDSRVEDLTTALAGRDETIAVLLEQTCLFEEAAQAQRAEWEQLTRWVEEVECRVEEQGGRDSRLGDELATERRRHVEAREGRESEARAWEVQRRSLEREVSDLRARLAAPQLPDGSNTALVTLEAENGRLREACAALDKAKAVAKEVKPLRERLAEALAERDRLRSELDQERDDRRREANEYEAELTALRSEHARALLESKAQFQPSARATTADSDSPENGSAAQADERIRALRDHLREIHQREAEERRARKLSGRLSRLWHRTGP